MPGYEITHSIWEMPLSPGYGDTVETALPIVVTTSSLYGHINHGTSSPLHLLRGNKDQQSSIQIGKIGGWEQPRGRDVWAQRGDVEISDDARE